MRDWDCSVVGQGWHFGGGAAAAREGCWQCGVKDYAFLDRFGVTGCFPFNEGRLVLVSSFCIRPIWIMTVNIRSVPATGTTTDNHSLV